MRSLVLLGLLGATLPASAHPTEPARPGIRRRNVDLNAYRITQSPQYHNAAASASQNLHTLKRDTYVETATALIKKVLPDATFRLVDDHYVGTNGISHVNFKQTVHGLDIDNADFNVNIARDGSIFSYGNSFYTGKIPAENPLRKRDFSEATKALETATSVLDIPVTGKATAEATEETETFTLKGTSGAQKDPEARLVYLVKPDGELALTWRVETDVLDNWLLSYVDAKSNDAIHGVVDWVQDATLKVYPWGVNDPDVGSRTVLTNPWDPVNSEFTWFGDGTTSYTDTRGNNAVAQTNPSGGTAWQNNYRPSSSSLDFQYDWSPTWATPSTYGNSSVTQLFYTANVYHDVLYDLGFTEAAGNFENNNNGQGGRGGDFVILNSQDGSGTNNANFATPPFSNRLTGGPANSNCLQTTEAGGMGEGWGDWFATGIRLKSTDTRDTDYSLGAWVYNNPKGIRKYLYSTKSSVNPYLYTTANTYNEVHDIGEIWATILYEVMWNLIDKHGLNTAVKPTFDSNGVPTDGKFLAQKLVVDAMALQPCNPNFVQARDAILDADRALTGGDNLCELWTAFAKRGLGDGAAFGNPRRGSTTIPSGVLRLSQRLCRLRLQQTTTRIGARAMATSGGAATIKKRVVAGSFLFKIPDGDDKQARVALFRRSNKVRTYQHKLAPCSGSVENDDSSPLAAALREIQEETTLPASSLELLRVGKPYAFTDESIGREWNINPFAFRLKTAAEGGKGEEGIKLDWEHDGIEWFDPMEVNGSDEFGGVPRLTDSLRRVWPEYELGPEAGRVLTQGLQSLRNDHEHGARELAGTAVLTLRNIVRQMAPSQPIDESWWSKVRLAAWHICQARPSMGAAITSATIKALDAIKGVYVADAATEDKIQLIIQTLDQQLAQRGHIANHIYQAFNDYVRQNVLRDGGRKKTVSILTLSSSSTIYGCLLQATTTLGVALDLHILESRPLCEGVTLASRVLDSLKCATSSVTLYSDASVALAARSVDLVLLGADRISSAGDVNNKIGSLPAALTARHVNPYVKILAVSDTEKIAGPGFMEDHSPEENSPSELSQAWKGTVEGAGIVETSLSHNPKVAIKNAYFEWIPADLIDAYITEDGVWSTEQIRQKSKWIDNEIEQYFEGL
ncbi:hypothetical protein NUW58_g863 [Xylaria curta]|uniref:Uncharacterized protein n=1 Tax=Xylaria curta TaxID=42375 RepID=A0ACC1PR01_9PEZI|nr:hypothetical protein NUW58_g863 [Xylaria curta]